MGGKPFEKGQSGNPGGRPKSAELRAVCREHSPKAVETLVALMDDKSPMIRFKASAEILDRAYGKAPQSIDVQMDDARPQQEEHHALEPHEVLLALGNVLSRAEKEAGIDPADGLSNLERMKRLVASGTPLSPPLYRAWLAVSPELKKSGPGPDGTWQ